MAELAIAFPIAVSIGILYLLGFALMFDGFGRIIDGITNKTNRRWIRGFHIGVGVLNVAISTLVLISLFGAIFAGLLIGFSLLIVEIQMITIGVMGRRLQIDSGATLRS